MVSQIKAWEPQAFGPGDFADESALVAGLRAGRAEAFEALHAAYAPSVYNLALRIVDDPHEAQDVAQEVLIKVLRGLPRDEGDFTLPAWLYRVTVNASFDHLRARKRRPVAVSAEAVSEPVSKVDEFERAELSRRVETTLRELPKRQQVALVLRDVHGLSVGETASALGVTKGSADVLLSRARAGFRKVFLAGAATGRCVEAEKILAGGVGGGTSAADRALLAEHTRTCPDCRREVALWGAAPVGLGLLLPQVALPAKLSFGATLAAAQAAGVALPAGLGATAAAAGASAAGAGGSVAGGTAAGASAATAAGAGSAATAAGGAGVLAALGSAAGLKIATLAAVATAAVGIAGVAAHERATTGRTAGVVPAAMAQGSGGPDGSAAGAGDGRQARLLTRAHRGGSSGPDGRGPGARGDGAAGQRSQKAQPGGGAGSDSGARPGDGSARSGGSASGGGAGGTKGSGTSQTGTGAGTGGSTGSAGGTGSSGGTDSGSGAGTGGGAGGSGTGDGVGELGGGGQSSGD